jgi:hypothetical protein
METSRSSTYTRRRHNKEDYYLDRHNAVDTTTLIQEHIISFSALITEINPYLHYKPLLYTVRLAACFTLQNTNIRRQHTEHLALQRASNESVRDTKRRAFSLPSSAFTSHFHPPSVPAAILPLFISLVTSFLFASIFHSFFSTPSCFSLSLIFLLSLPPSSFSLLRYLPTFFHFYFPLSYKYLSRTVSRGNSQATERPFHGSNFSFKECIHKWTIGV